MTAGLVDILRAALPDREAPDELEAVLAGCRAAAVAACPGVNVADDRFVRAIAARLPAELSTPHALAALQTADLYLACGLADRDPGALALFEASYGRVIERAVAATGVPTSERADLAQLVRQRMLVGAPGRPPRITGYSARGSLGAWVRVIVTREASRLYSRERPEVAGGNDELARRIAPDNPELDYLKRRYREEFKRAFQTAIDALDSRDRLVLRQHTLDGLGIDQLAALHKVHRATAARWIASARDAVLGGTQRALTRELRLSPSELDSMIRLVLSQLDVSLHRLLGEPAER